MDNGIFARVYVLSLRVLPIIVQRGILRPSAPHHRSASSAMAAARQFLRHEGLFSDAVTCQNNWMERNNGKIE